MSLKAVHIFFVVVATTIAAGASVWAIQQALATGGAVNWILAVLSSAMTISLPVYGGWFLKKTKEVGYV